MATDTLASIHNYHTLRLKVLSHPKNLSPLSIRDWNRTQTLIELFRYGINVPHENQREWKRFDLEKIVNVEVDEEPKSIFYGICRNISLGGVFIETEVTPRMGDFVKISILDEEPQKNLLFWGRVKWIKYLHSSHPMEKEYDMDEQPVGLGIQFVTDPSLIPVEPT